MQIETIIVIITLIIFLLTFIMFFILIMISIIKGFKISYHTPMEIEKLSCPRCSSKELEAIGYRTIKCRKCGFIFSIGGEVYYGWFPWIFFWPLWFSIIFFKEK
ncbi:MAG: hypothetical protein QXP60_03715 [Nitrososphaerota archaeon]